ncbi:uncharacterized protein LOC120798384 isoform X4 [Xiphias gladius]|uniref:uncharacterized protein LOC120798384 isoform X4 n=1 Tax=Xiphias gladius TaxID=8245 RepID=UPI001A994CD2|nr:uncharacterized protein LOC120798384 isoform X4 [Xiphias gladius]
MCFLLSFQLFYHCRRLRAAEDTSGCGTTRPQMLQSREAGFSERGYVDILCAATEASNTMNGGDFGSLPRITDGCGPCAMYLKDSVDSLFRYDSHFPGQTSISRTRKPERRRADRPETTAAATG